MKKNKSQNLIVMQKKLKKLLFKVRKYNEQLLTTYQSKLTKLKKQIKGINNQKKRYNYQLSIIALEHKIQSLQEKME